MEDALRVRCVPTYRHPRRVLILVLMEDALRVLACTASSWRTTVLILVLMEDALRVRHVAIADEGHQS